MTCEENHTGPLYRWPLCPLHQISKGKKGDFSKTRVFQKVGVKFNEYSGPITLLECIDV